MVWVVLDTAVGGTSERLVLDERVLEGLGETGTYRSILLKGNEGKEGLDGEEVDAVGTVAVAMDFLTASMAAVPAAVALVLKFFAPALKPANELETFGFGRVADAAEAEQT